MQPHHARGAGRPRGVLSLHVLVVLAVTLAVAALPSLASAERCQPWTPKAIATDASGTWVTFGGDDGPTVGNYGDLVYEWVITGPAGYIHQIEVLSFTAGAYTTWLPILSLYDGGHIRSKYVGLVYGGDAMPVSFTSSGNVIYAQLSSSSTSGYSGIFRARVRSVRLVPISGNLVVDGDGERIQQSSSFRPLTDSSYFCDPMSRFPDLASGKQSWSQYTVSAGLLSTAGAVFAVRPCSREVFTDLNAQHIGGRAVCPADNSNKVFFLGGCADGKETVRSRFSSGIQQLIALQDNGQDGRDIFSYQNITLPETSWEAIGADLSLRRCFGSNLQLTFAL
eukprot:tig00021178_g19193.t1